MNDDKLEGIGKQVTGSLKEAIGKVTGDSSTQAEGRAEKQDGERRTDAGDTRERT